VPLQTASADNDPADTQYSTAMSAAYDNALYGQLNTYSTLSADSTAGLKRTSSKFKLWKLKVVKVVNQIKVSSKKFAEISASPGYVSSQALAVAANVDRQNWASIILAYYQKSKVTIKETTKVDDAAAQANNSLLAWSNQYQKDLDLANLAIPSSAPTVSFNTNTDTDTGLKSLQATTTDTSTFSQSRLYISEYLIEWYYKDANSSPITNSAKVEDLTKPLMFQLDGVLTGDKVFFKVAAKNAMGQGPWSSIFSTTVL
jgi:hypothetical protein